MDAIRFGSDIRLLRRQRGWTQERLASESHVTRAQISAIETGHGGQLPVERLIQVAAALGAFVSVRLMFRGESLDRLRDRRHAAMVESLARRLVSAGWEILTEVSFNEYGERGSIDVLAFHPGTGALLVIEVKTVVPDVGGMLMTLDRKVRLSSEIAKRHGWSARTVSRLLVLPEVRTARRRVEAHVVTFARAFPARNVAVSRWLRQPTGSLSGLLFLSDVTEGRTSRAAASRRRRP
jgi:transcriptional regulator with XRE-family HTH domain